MEIDTKALRELLDKRDKIDEEIQVSSHRTTTEAEGV